MGLRLPGGFSPWQAIQQGVDTVNPFDGGHRDRDVFSDISFEGGERNPTQTTGSVLGVSYGPQQYATGPGAGNQPAPGSTSAGVTGGGGSVGGSAFYDPYAAARASFQSRLGGAIGNIRQSGLDAFGSAGRNLRGQAEQLFNTISQGQKAIDRSRENVEMNRLGGIDDILSFVRNGLKSGASMLANKNALGSSAARAIAEAYGTEGGNRTRKVNNQASLQGREIDTQQESLDLQRGQGRTDFSRSRDDMVATIGQQVRAQLADLEDQAMQIGATGPQVEAERQRIIDEGIGQLNEVDAWLQQMLGGVGRQDMDTTRKNAVALRQGGAEMTPFEFGEFQTGFNGPAINQLPIFLRPRDRE